VKSARALVIGLASAVVEGCDTPGVKEISPSEFSVSAQYDFWLGGWERAQEDALVQGKQYCAAKDRPFKFIEEQRSGTAGLTPLRSTIKFKCANAQVGGGGR
jgi:hypothetical protein